MMNATVINTLNKSEWIVELSYRHSFGHIMAYTVCDDVAYALKLETELYRKAAENYGAKQTRTAIYHLIPKKNFMVFSLMEDAIKFKEEWIESQLLVLRLANIVPVNI